MWPRAEAIRPPCRFPCCCTLQERWRTSAEAGIIRHCCVCFTWEMDVCCAVYKSIRGITAVFMLNLPIVPPCFPAWEFSGGHWEQGDLSQGLLFSANSAFLHIPLCWQNAADWRLAWDAGGSWRVTDSSRLDWETNKLWRESWRFASEKIRVAFGSRAKMHRCSCHTAMATEASCLPPRHRVTKLYQRVI